MANPPDNKVSVVIEINNQQVPDEFPAHQPIEQSLRQFLHKTKNTPADPAEWNLLNGATKIDQSMTWLAAKIADGTHLRLRLKRDGIGA